MKEGPYISRLSGSLKAKDDGNKVRSILFLSKNKFRIPLTYILSSRAYDDYLANRQKVIDRLVSELDTLPDIEYAVRSSTSIEDSGDFSYAGQFQTFTSVRGVSNILHSIEKVWESATDCEQNDYRRKVSDSDSSIRCAVIIQEMVNSELSGVSFSKNPVNNLNEVIVEAVEGMGQELVQKGITPHRWRIREKRIIEGPEDFPLQHVVEEIAKATKRLKKLYKSHVDLEWAYDGREIYYLQIRSITGSGRIPVYSNRMAREMLPGQIKPLVWSVNIPMVNGTWIQILSEITGKLNVKPEELAHPFYYRAYFNMLELGEIFREFGLSASVLEFMLLEDESSKPKFKLSVKTLRHLPRIISFIRSKLNIEKFYLGEYKTLQNNYLRLKNQITDGFELNEYPELFNRLFIEGRRLTYLNIIIPLLMQYYNKRLRKKLSKRGTDYELINFNKDFPQLDDLTPTLAMNRLRSKFEDLPMEIKEAGLSLEEVFIKPEAIEFKDEFNSFIMKFGHLSDSGNDFSVSKWEEYPELLFDMIKQSPEVATNRKLINFDELISSKPEFKRLYSSYMKAGRYKVYREEISSLYVFGYGLFRYLFLNLGKEFKDRGIIGSPDDIFYLTKEETDEVINGIKAGNTERIDRLIELRKADMEATRDIVLPPVIYGDKAPVIERDRVKNIKGVATSSGICTGKTKIVKGISEFAMVNRGDIIVIPFSDISWTPILVKAGAIVSESGGMLSHCSIIAREMGIPAIVSVEAACALPDNISVTVDGSNGILTIHDYE
jgi:phosphohistidine swiveling domain-containing protein